MFHLHKHVSNDLASSGPSPSRREDGCRGQPGEGRSRARRQLRSCALLIATLISSTARAATSETSTTRTQPLYSPPDVYKVGPGSAFLRSGDFNGDGLADLVCADNGKSLLYFLCQQKNEERCFKIVEMPLESVVGSLAAGDFNGDGRTDLALGGAQSFIRYQDAKGGLSDPKELEEDAREALAEDFNGDGKTDLILLDTDRLILLPQRDGKLGPAVRRRNTYKAGGAPLCFDLNGDGKLDLVYRDTGVPDKIIARFQNDSADFDPEIAFKAGFNYSIDGASRLGADGAGLVAAEDKTRVLKALRLAPDETIAADAARFSLIRLLPYADDGSTAKSALEVEDLDGDDRLEVISLCEERPSMDVLHCAPRGSMARQTVPSLLGVRKLRIGRSDASGRTYWALSAKEQTIGAARIGGRDAATTQPLDLNALLAASAPAAGGIAFPQPLDLGAQPQAFDLADLDSSGYDDLVFVAAAKKDRKLVVVHDPVPESFAKARRTETDLLALLGDSAKDLNAVELMTDDMNSDGRTDVAIFPEYGDVQILLQNEKGEFKPFLAGAGVSKGLFEGVKPAQFLVADLLDDGRNEILVAKSGFARILSLDAAGNLAIKAQLNGKGGSSRIVAVAAGDIMGHGRRDVLLIDRGERVASVFARIDGAKEFKVVKHVEMDDLAAESALVADLNGDKKGDLIIGATESFGVIFSGWTDPALKTVAMRKTDVEDGGYRLAAAGPVVPGAGECLVGIENKEHLLEIWQLGPQDKPGLLYKFKVFGGEGAHGFFDPSQARPPQPREIGFPDLNADGLPDLAALVHDKIVAYLQQSKSPGKGAASMAVEHETDAAAEKERN